MSYVYYPMDMTISITNASDFLLENVRTASWVCELSTHSGAKILMPSPFKNLYGELSNALKINLHIKLMSIVECIITALNFGCHKKYLSGVTKPPNRVKHRVLISFH